MNNNNILIIIALISVTVITWVVQDWRYDSTISKIKVAYSEEKAAMTNAANEGLQLQLEINKRLSEELIKSKNRSLIAKNNRSEKINELSKNSPHNCKFDANWVRLYNYANSGKAD